jgi:cation-transporting ATPase E
MVQSTDNKKAIIPPNITGLSDEEVKYRFQEGLVNDVAEDMSRSTKNIIFKNCFTLFNVIIMVLAVIVMLTGEFMNAIFFWVVLVNAFIGIYQELKAKRTIDKLSVLAKSTVAVVRNRTLYSIPHEDIVLGDVLYLTAGNQVPSDGRVLYAVGLEVDESLLTGESDNIIKEVSSSVMSGSFITAGEAYVEVTAVGEDNYSAKLTKEAKIEKRNPSELMNSLNMMIKILSILIIPVGIGLFLSQYKVTGSFKQTILGVSAAVVSMIPEGLMLLTSVAFAVGAANLAKKKTLVQSLPCIETLARVDTICLDKTGTITDGTLAFEEYLLQNEMTDLVLKETAGQVMASLPDNNATAKTVRNYFPNPSTLWKSSKVIPFSSARKWSGVTFLGKGSYVLGAPEFIFQNLPEKIEHISERYTNDGYRVLAFVHFDGEIESDDLPETGDIIALMILSDTIRSTAKDTFSYFEHQDVTLKVISGDNPVSVSNIAIQAGIKNAENYVDMSRLEEDTDFSKLVEENAVFGRVTPYQKRELIRALKSNGHTTCMTGDGVNDVLSLREADVGVAMASGSDAAKSSSDVILLTSDFSAMIEVLKEGRRVINNIERVAAMYLVKTIYSILLSVLSISFGFTYPFAPLQLAPINTLTVGIPSFFLALKPSYERIKGRFVTNIINVSLPAALTVIISIFILQIAQKSFQLESSSTSTMSVFVTGCIGFHVLYQIAKPLDLKRKFLIGSLFTAFVLCFIVLPGFFMYDSLLNRNVFFYLPLALGGRSMFNFLSYIISKMIYYVKKALSFVKKKEKLSAS